MTYNIRSYAIRWQIADFLSNYVIAIVMLALSLAVYEIFTKQDNCQNFDLENEGHGQEL